jgi:general secretion pathway protein F
MSFVVPRFVPLFADAGATLPLMTKIVFAIAGLAQSLWWLGALGIIGALLYFDRWKSDPLNRRRLDAWLLKLPQLGDILRQVETARITRTLGSLTSNGLPLHSSLKLSREVCQNSVFRDLMDQCCSSIEQGRRLSESLESADVFPSLASELIAIGDESGQLEPMLLKVADSCEETAQKTIRRSLTLIEPVMILGLGAVIAFVIVAILMAMLGLNDLVA